LPPVRARYIPSNTARPPFLCRYEYSRMSSKRRVLTPTQSHTIQDDSDADVPLKIQTSGSLRWKLPVSDSANLFRVGEDTTLCYAPRSSECDLTACASASSGFKMKNSPAPSSLELFLPDLPEIPDWYEDEQPKQASRSPEPVPAIPAHVFNTPTLDTPQSDYHSLEDYHPTSLCCQDILAELAAAQCSDGAACESPGLVLSSCKHNPQPPQTVQAPSHGRPPFTHHIRRSYSLDLVDQRARAAEFPYMVRFIAYLYSLRFTNASEGPTGRRPGLRSGLALLPGSHLVPHQPRRGPPHAPRRTRPIPIRVSLVLSRSAVKSKSKDVSQRQPKLVWPPPLRGAFGLASPGPVSTLSTGSPALAFGVGRCPQPRAALPVVGVALGAGRAAPAPRQPPSPAVCVLAADPTRRGSTARSRNVDPGGANHDCGASGYGFAGHALRSTGIACAF
jgi:hypothetical protein